MDKEATDYSPASLPAPLSGSSVSNVQEEGLLGADFFSPQVPATLSFLDDLTPEQKQAALANGPTLVLAGAGTGKTKTLTSALARRLCEGMPPHRILAITFTNKAAEEMRERVKVLYDGISVPPWMGTFHSIGCRLLRMYPEIAGLQKNFMIADQEDSQKIVKRIAKRRELDDSADSVRAYMRAIENYKDWLCTPEEASENVGEVIAEMTSMGLRLSEEHMYEVLPLYADYQRELRETNMADFSDLLMWVTREMEKSEQFRRRVAARWDAILVDEYQDVNNSQYRFVRSLARDHRELFVVGDDDQSIYGFRNAHVAFIRKFEQDFTDATVVRLEENFRSTQTILEAANAIIQMDDERMGKTLYTSNPKGAPINVVSTSNDWAEGDFVVRALGQALSNGYQPEDVAILYRSNYLSLTLEMALNEARLPYKLVGDVSFWERREIKDGISLMQLAAYSDSKQSDLAFRRMVNVPSRGIGDAKLRVIEQVARDHNVSLFQAAKLAPIKGKAGAKLQEFVRVIEPFRSEANDTPLDIFLEELLEQTGYQDFWRASKDEKATERLQNLSALRNYLKDKDDLETLLEDIALVKTKDESEQNAISLMTIHRAKGMEFPVVILVGWEEGIFPSGMSMDERGMQEEARLAYVAVTRCKEHLIISCCHNRRRSSSSWAPESRFIGAIPSEIMRRQQYQ